MIFKKNRATLNNTGAIELSVGTIVIIVLGMTMLILGLVLVKQIFSVATKSVDSIDGQVKDEINKQLGSQEGYIIIYTGEGKDVARVKAGSGDFGVAIAARTLDGSATDRARLKYRLSLAAPTGKNCVDEKILGELKTADLFKTPLNKQNDFDKFEADKARALLEINVPAGTPECTQKVLVDVTDSKTGQSIGGSGFTLQIIKGGFFG